MSKHSPKPHCLNSEPKLCSKRDAYYCPECGTWLEEKCGDKECELCLNRPEKHSCECK